MAKLSEWSSYNRYVQGGMVELTGKEKTRTVAGVQALSGELAIQKGMLGRGYWCVFMKGDRYYACVFINVAGQMGPKYAEEDFEKFMNGFQFMDKE